MPRKNLPFLRFGHMIAAPVLKMGQTIEKMREKKYNDLINCL